MPKILEDKLKKEYPGNPHAVYGTLNKIGAMHGSKETAKGKAIEKKLSEDTSRRFKHNPFAKKYKEKNEGREEARKREHAIPEMLKRK